MKIILIRHGDAGAYTHPDSERQLSALGKQQAQLTAQWLAEQPKIDQYIVSPYHRAKQTQEVISDTLEKITQTKAPVSICDGITPDDSASTAVATLATLIDDELIIQEGVVAIVCHMPIIAKIDSILTGQAPTPFALAEARIYEGVVGADMAVPVASFVPRVSVD